MTKRRRLDTYRFDLEVGRNELIACPNYPLVGEIQFQSTCDAVITQVLHGAKSLLREGQQPIAGSGCRPGACLLRLSPPERLHLNMMFIVEAAKKGKMIISLYAPNQHSFDAAVEEVEVTLNKKTQELILREIQLPKASWSKFKVTALVRSDGTKRMEHARALAAAAIRPATLAAEFGVDKAQVVDAIAKALLPFVRSK